MQIPKSVIEKAKEEGYKLAEKDFKDDHKVKYGLGLEAGKSEAFSLVRKMIKDHFDGRKEPRDGDTYTRGAWETGEEFLFQLSTLEGGGTVKKCVPSDIMLMSNPPSYKCKNCGQTWRNNEPTPFCQLGHKCTDGVACNCPTVEKCCLFCIGTLHGKYGGCLCHKMDKNESHDKPCCYHQSCGCSCHNKKEEYRCMHGVHGADCNKCFNHETPSKMKAVPMSIFQAGDSIPKEEVELPEMLETVPKIVTELGEKINEILTYLASKENKGDK